MTVYSPKKQVCRREKGKLQYPPNRNSFRCTDWQRVSYRTLCVNWMADKKPGMHFVCNINLVSRQGRDGDNYKSFFYSRMFRGFLIDAVERYAGRQLDGHMANSRQIGQKTIVTRSELTIGLNFLLEHNVSEHWIGAFATLHPPPLPPSPTQRNPGKRPVNTTIPIPKIKKLRSLRCRSCPTSPHTQLLGTSRYLDTESELLLCSTPPPSLKSWHTRLSKTSPISKTKKNLRKLRCCSCPRPGCNLLH